MQFTCTNQRDLPFVSCALLLVYFHLEFAGVRRKGLKSLKILETKTNFSEVLANHLYRIFQEFIVISSCNIRISDSFAKSQAVWNTDCKVVIVHVCCNFWTYILLTCPRRICPDSESKTTQWSRLQRGILIIRLKNLRFCILLIKWTPFPGIQYSQ